MIVLALLACTSSAPPPEPPPDPVVLRVATFNVSMFRGAAGQLADDLSDPEHLQAVSAAKILAEVSPDVLLLNEFDYDAQGLALDRFVDGFGLDYPHRRALASNTGESSGFDLNNDGTVTTEPGSREYAEDCWGFGEFPGQYAMAVVSRYPIGSVRTFRELKWSDVPGAQLPDGWFDPDEAAAVRLSSKTHGDVSIDIGGREVHLLVSHPTPPGFDGPEDRNGLRNAAEVRFWADYVSGGDWMTDDAGVSGGIGAGPFVIAGDLNADPVDGDSVDGIGDVLASPRVNDGFVPTSSGAVAAAGNDGHRGDPAADTADFGSFGNLRVDYVLPSTELEVLDGGVFWPEPGQPLFDEVARDPMAVSDHRLVWIDVRVE